MRLFWVLLLVCLMLPAGALASGQDVIRDCGDDERFEKTYTQKEYREALEQLGADTDEYTNCRDVIHRAQLAAAGQGKGSKDQGSGGDGAATGAGGGGQGPTPTDSSSGTEIPAPAPEPAPNPAEQQALQAARSSQASALIDPSKVGSAPGVDGDGGLPGPVIALLIALGLAATGLAATRLRSLVLTHRAT